MSDHVRRRSSLGSILMGGSSNCRRCYRRISDASGDRGLPSSARRPTLESIPEKGMAIRPTSNVDEADLDSDDEDVKGLVRVRLVSKRCRKPDSSSLSRSSGASMFPHKFSWYQQDLTHAASGPRPSAQTSSLRGTPSTYHTFDNCPKSLTEFVNYENPMYGPLNSLILRPRQTDPHPLQTVLMR